MAICSVLIMNQMLNFIQQIAQNSTWNPDSLSRTLISGQFLEDAGLIWVWIAVLGWSRTIAFCPCVTQSQNFHWGNYCDPCRTKSRLGGSCDLIVWSPGCTLTYPWTRWMAETWKCHRNCRISCMQICLLACALHAKIEQMGLWVSELLLKNPNHWLSAFKERDGLLEVGRADESSAMFVSFPIMSHSGHEPPTSQTGNPPNTQYTLICTHPQVVKTEDWWIKKLSTGVVQAFTWLYFFSFLLF